MKTFTDPPKIALLFNGNHFVGPFATKALADESAENIILSSPRSKGGVYVEMQEVRTNPIPRPTQRYYRGRFIPIPPK